MIGELVPDKTYRTMFRVRMPDGTLSDILNRQRAVELSRLLRLEARNQPKGKTAA